MEQIVQVIFRQFLSISSYLIYGTISSMDLSKDRSWTSLREFIFRFRDCSSSWVSGALSAETSMMYSDVEEMTDADDPP